MSTITYVLKTENFDLRRIFYGRNITSIQSRAFHRSNSSWHTRLSIITGFSSKKPRSVLHLVLDTNTALSGLLWSGTPKRLIAAARALEVTLFSSVPLLEELGGVILRKKFRAISRPHQRTRSDSSSVRYTPALTVRGDPGDGHKDMTSSQTSQEIPS